MFESIQPLDWHSNHRSCYSVIDVYCVILHIRLETKKYDFFVKGTMVRNPRAVNYL